MDRDYMEYVMGEQFAAIFEQEQDDGRDDANNAVQTKRDSFVQPGNGPVPLEGDPARS